MKQLIIMIQLVILTQIPTSCTSQNQQYKIFEEKELNHYWAFIAIDKSENKEVVLLSEKEENCSSMTKLEIGKTYSLDCKRITSIKVEKDIYVQLGRSQSIDGFKISEKGKFPLLIANSCDGYLKSVN